MLGFDVSQYFVVPPRLGKSPSNWDNVPLYTLREEAMLSPALAKAMTIMSTAAAPDDTAIALCPACK